jgi:hypothetical protein
LAGIILFKRCPVRVELLLVNNPKKSAPVREIRLISVPLLHYRRHELKALGFGGNGWAYSTIPAAKTKPIDYIPSRGSASLPPGYDISPFQGWEFLIHDRIQEIEGRNPV